MNGRRSKEIRHIATRMATNNSGPIGRYTVFWPKGSARRIYKDLKKEYTSEKNLRSVES